MPRGYRDGQPGGVAGFGAGPGGTRQGARPPSPYGGGIDLGDVGPGGRFVQRADVPARLSADLSTGAAPGEARIGRKTHGWLWMSVVLSLAIGLVVLQQFAISMGSARLGEHAQRHAFEERITEPGYDSLSLQAKVMVRLQHLYAEQGAELAEIEWELDALEEEAGSAADVLRVAVLAGELLGPAAALERIDALEASLSETASLRSDTLRFRRLFEAKVGEDGGSAPAATSSSTTAARVHPATPLEEHDLQNLRARHGWFVDLALAVGRDASDPLRWRLVSGGASILGFGVIIGLTSWAIGLAALAVGVWFVRKLWRQEVDSFAISASGEGVWIETFAVWMCFGLLFIGLGSAAMMSSGGAAVGLYAASEVLVWCSGLALLYPVFRGVPWLRVRHALGLTIGDGLHKEIGWGVLGFFVSTAVTIVVAMSIGIVSAMFGGGSETAAEDLGISVFDHPIPPTPLVVALGTATAVLWAPIFEEIFFRGALYQFLRGALPAWATIALTSLLFGAIHPYGWDGVLQVALGGVVYGMLREWRGSLVAPMVAHFLHNGLISLEEIGWLTVIA